MVAEPKELLLKMKECEYVFDTKIGQSLNRNYDEDKYYVLKILDLLFENYDRIQYIDDLSSSKIGKKSWALLISEKFAMMDKRIPIPQVPFHIITEGKNRLTMRPKEGYLLLLGFLKALDDEIHVCLNFKNTELRNIFMNNLSKGEK
jgi:hypothetical protein